MNEKVQNFTITKLNNSNYSAWAFKMKMYLMKENCWTSIEHEEGFSEAIAKQDLKAWNHIILGIDDDQLVHVRLTKGGQEAWKILKGIHVQTTLSARIRIMKTLFKIRLSREVTMQQHLQEIFENFHQLSEIGYGLANDMSVSVILASLPSEYEPLITALEAWDENRLTIEAVRSKLLEEWKRKEQMKSGETSESALQSIRKDITCLGCGKKGHIKRFCRNVQKTSTDERANVAKVAFSAVESRVKNRKIKIIHRICYNCRETGHQSSMCPKNVTLKSEVGENFWKINDDQSAKMARLSKMYSCVTLRENEFYFQNWIIDSGASNHMCCDKNLFSDLQHGSFGDIVIASGEKVFAKGKGKITLFVGLPENVIEMTLLNVLFVPDLKANLISVRKITEKGFCVNFSETGCFLKGKSVSCMIGKYANGIYEIMQPKVNCATSFIKDLCVHDWHKRLAHRHLSDVKRLRAIGINIKACKCSDLCDACVKGKMSKKPFPKVAQKKSERLECIVSDLCGPMQVESVGKSKYFITFTDLFSGYTETVFMRKKDETTDKVIQFIEKLKTSLKEKPVTFRSDRGGEFLNHRLQSYLKNEGIKFECTVAYSPEQNGVSERKNRTLVEAARTMLVDSCLPKKFWAEAVHNATYTFNRIPKEDNKTPYELMFEKTPEFEFYEFGCDVYVMTPYEKRRKLDDKAEIMKFLGHDNNSKGYRVLRQNGAIKISRDVKFVRQERSNEYVIEEDCDFDPTREILKSSCEKVSSSERSNSSETVTDDEGIDANNTVISVSDEDVFESPKVSPAQRQSRGFSEPPQTSPDEPESRRQRTKSRPAYLDDYVLMSVNKIVEPRCYSEAIKSEASSEWIKAMKEELESIEANKTWVLTDLPTNRKSIGSKWVFKAKADENGNVARYKARLVAQGFTQKFGVDYDEVFAPVARSSTMRVLLSFAGKHKFFAKHFDVKTAFLNGILEEEVFMRQPPGFKNSDQVYKLNKSLYGLKQAARVWNLALHNELISLNFIQSDVDKCLYVLREQGKVVYLLVHVDDMILVGNDEKTIESVVIKINQKFELKDLGNIKHFLGIDVEKDEDGNFVLSQSRYIEKIIEEAGLCDAKPSKFPLDPGYFKLNDENFLQDNHEYRQLIGMLLYLTTHSRPDISASVSILSQKISKPNQTDINEVKRVIRYLKGTKNFKLKLSNALREQSLFSFSDANWAEDRNTRKSNSGYLCNVNGGAVSWSCRKQDLIALSSTEAEYIALSETCKETIWLKRLMKLFDANDCSPTLILTDSQSCLKMINFGPPSTEAEYIAL